jgi:hypothetical protein
MQSASYRTKDARGLVVLAARDHLHQRGRALRTRHQQGFAIVGQYRLPPTPPHQAAEQAAGLLFGHL